MKSIYKTLLVLLLSCCQYYMAAAQDRTNAYGYQFTAEELAQYPQKTDLPTVYLDVYRMNVDATTGEATLALDEHGNPQRIDYTEVFGTKYDWYYSANIIIRDDNGTIEERNQSTTVRGRGNSTWNLGNNQYKKGLRLKFDKKVALLGDGYANSKSWTLLANNYDPTLIRNAMTYELGKKIGMPFCPAYKFVDLVVCGHYMGTYQFSDQVQVAKDRVNIDENTGYFLELFGGWGFVEDPYFYINSTAIGVNIKSPDPDVTSSGETSDPKYAALKTWMGKVADLAYNGHYDRPVTWRTYVDVDAAVRAMIGMDITGNYDGAKGNNYVYMNDLDSKLFFGPLWDLDLAWGGLVNNKNMTERHFWDNGEDDTQAVNLYKVYKRVFENDPYFVKALWEKWQQVYNGGSIITYLQNKADALHVKVANSAALNFKSEAEGGAGHSLNKNNWNEYNVYADWDATVTVMKTFIHDHIEWLNTNYKARYDALDCDNLPEIPQSEFYDEGEGDYNSHIYIYYADPANVRANATLTISLQGTNPHFDIFTTQQYTPWIKTNGTNAPYDYERQLTAEDVSELKSNGYSFRLVVYEGTCDSISLTPPACTEHNYENCEYAKQTDGTYRRMCTVCSEVETEGDVYYQFTVYPESETANAPIYATSWAPSEEHPNSVAAITVDNGKEPAGYNIINRTKNADGDKQCADFRLTDGHPYFSDDAFAAATATYSRNVSNEWGTMVLPFKQQNAVTATANYYHLSEVSGTGEEQTLVLTPIQPEIEDNASAFVPVFFRAKEGVTTVNVTATNVKVKKSKADTDITNSTVAGWTLKGVMEQTVFNVGAGQADEGRNLYYISNNKFWHATGKLTMNPFRAYIETDTPSQAARFALFADDSAQPTAISQPTQGTVIACVEQGGLRLSGAAGAKVRVSSIGGSLLFDAAMGDGQSVFLPLAAGIYIVNGTKVMIK